MARAAINEDIQSGKLQGVENIPPLQMPKTVPLDQLPPEKRQELAEYLASYKQQAPALAEAQAKHRAAMQNLAGLDPSVLQAVQTAQGPPTHTKGFHLVDSRASSPAQPAQPDVPTGWPPTQQATQDQAGEEKPAKPPPTFTQLDKANYLMAILPGNQSFRKEYTYLGGRLRVIYRDPPVAHINLLIRQANEDAIRSLPALLASDYRCAIYLDKITLDNEILDISSQVDQFLKEQPASAANVTALPDLVIAMQQVEPFDKNALWSLLLGGVHRFSGLVNELEASASAPDF
jgi:hypothetical protein